MEGLSACFLEGGLKAGTTSTGTPEFWNSEAVVLSFIESRLTLQHNKAFYN